MRGSASFTPDGARLLIDTVGNVARIHDLRTGQSEPVPLLPGPRVDTTVRGTPRLLGFADDERLLILKQRGRTMVLATSDPAGLDRRPVVQWTGGEDMDPLVASMPPGYWI